MKTNAPLTSEIPGKVPASPVRVPVRLKAGQSKTVSFPASRPIEGCIRTLSRQDREMFLSILPRKPMGVRNGLCR